MRYTIPILLSSIFFVACTSEQKSSTLFHELAPDHSGITFENKVVQDQNNHVLNYPYYFNGGGVAVGDINNDGLPDIYFSGNTVANRLYLNKGNLKFEDITDKAGVAVAQGWKTGVTMADVNQDGYLDIYVCRSALSDSTIRQNQLFINNKDLTFTEKATEYGVNDNGYSTQGAFFDYDRDGDLDLFVLNHSLPSYAGFNNMLINFKKQPSTRFASKLFQNNGGKFTDVSVKVGLVNNVLSFGLGVAISDINADRWPDLYISNDFNEEDYLYVNNGDGTFANNIRDAMGHVSLFSMGSDIADINNDGLPDIYTLDMMPETNERIKLSSGDDNYDKYNILVKSGFHHQSMRNMLQLNNGDGTFSEIGQLMGISNTDWSWSTMFADFDNDGWKDLYVSNGYEKDYTNMQFLKYTVDEQLKSQRTGSRIDIQQVIAQMPAIGVGNFVYRNTRDLGFVKANSEWGLTRAFKSNGAASADLDNDGDIDVVVNTMNESSVIFQNTAADTKAGAFLKVDLRTKNLEKIPTGTKVMVYAGGISQYQEFSETRGFQSCAYVPLNFGLGKATAIDSVRIIWPDQKSQLITTAGVNTTITPVYAEATDAMPQPTKSNPLFIASQDVTWKHAGPVVNDFKRQLLLPRMLSYTGPRIAHGDVNGDGLQDLYVCGAQHQAGALFLQQQDGTFREKDQPVFTKDKEHQDEDAVFFDADGDGDLDLYVVSGGYNFMPDDPLLQDRLYINNGKAVFSRSTTPLPAERLAGSCVVSFDVNGDGKLDLFVGSRLTPGSYPIPSPSLLLVNEGKGKFRDEGKLLPATLQKSMICDAVAADIDKDGFSDLIVAGEWTPLTIIRNVSGQLKDDGELPATTGWWNCLISGDFDGDGDIDFIAGNYGENNQFHAGESRPVEMVYKDFNNDGQVDPFMTYYIGDQTFPYASRDEALGQVGTLRPRFPDYTSYANVTLDQIFKPEELKDAVTLKAGLLKSVMLINDNGKFNVRPLPVEAQFAPVYALAAIDVDHDGDLDIVSAGNETMTRVRIGKSDASYGAVFLNDGKSNFSYVSQANSGLSITGDVRDIVITNGKMPGLVVGVNNNAIRTFRLNANNHVGSSQTN